MLMEITLGNILTMVVIVFSVGVVWGIVKAKVTELELTNTKQNDLFREELKILNTLVNSSDIHKIRIDNLESWRLSHDIISQENVKILHQVVITSEKMNQLITLYIP